MLHKNRVWQIADLSTLEEAAHKLYGHTWTSCTAFRVGDLIFVNDSTGEDNAQEYAVVWVGKKERPARADLPARPLPDVVVTRSISELQAALGPGPSVRGAPAIEPPMPSTDPAVVVGIEIESLTVSWYESEAKLLADFQTLASGELGQNYGRVEIRTHPPTERCSRCA